MLLVGKPGGFTTQDDFHRFAADCGFTGVTMPTGFLDVPKAIESSNYRDDFQHGLHKCGLTDGMVRCEMHTDGQGVCLLPGRAKRFGHFLAPDRFLQMGHLELEKIAKLNMLRNIDLSAAFGFKYLPGFCGGRGFAAAMAKWPAWPKHFAPWVMALLAYKWNPVLEYAADNGVIITFEIGHPENDLLTGENFVEFFNLLSPSSKTAVGVNADWSHFLNIGIDPRPHMEDVSLTLCKVTNHYKWGAVVDKGDGGASMYGGWRNWSNASTTFFTYATVGPDSLARDFHSFNFKRTEAQGDAYLDVVYEGEDDTIKNPKQAMRIGAGNCLAAINNTPFAKVEGVIADRDFVLTRPTREATDVRILKANGVYEVLTPWKGGPFDFAFDSPLKPWELLEMNEEETAACHMILAAAGLGEAANAR